MNLKRLSAVPRFFGRVINATVGQFQWKPPSWMRGISGSVEDHPNQWLGTLVLLALLGFGGWKGWQWWEGHKPRPRELVAERQIKGEVTPPGLSVVKEGERVLPPLTVKFDGAVAALEQVGKDDPVGVSLSPSHPGTWKWTSDKLLVFTPSKDWPAGTAYEVSLDTRVLPKEVKIKEREWKFSTPAMVARVASAEFYTDPTDPSVHQVVVDVQMSHPVTKEEFEKHVSLEVLGGAPLFAWKGQTPKSLYSIVEGKNQQQYWIRTARIQVPEKEDFLKITLRAGIESVNGGRASEKDVSEKVRVPDVLSGLKVADAKTEIIRTDEGEPEQFLFLSTEGYVTSEEIAKNVEAWLLPKDKPAQGREKKIEDYEWSAAGEITAAVLALSKKVPLKHVESEQEFTETHAFKMLLEEEGILFIRVRAGMQGLGGFKLARTDARFAPVPQFPKEVELLGKGALLALNGERKLPVKARGLSHVRYSLARVPAGQVNHLVTLTEGDFGAPQFRESWIFNEENIARIRREVKPLPMKNEYEAVYSAFDFAPELSAPDASDPDATRGLFFLTAEGVRPRTDEDGMPEVEEGEETDAEELKWVSLKNEAFTKRFVLVTDLGLLVKQNADGSRDVFVQSIQTGDPVNGARVLVLAKNGEFIAEATTVDGHVKFKDVAHLRNEKQPVAILARLGNDLSFIPFERVDRALDFSRFDIAGVFASEKEALDAFVYTERGVYRPGDDVHVGTIVRRRDWKGALAGLPVEIQVMDSRDHEAHSEELALPEDGYLVWDCSIQESDPTGVYQVNVFLLNKDDKNGEGRERIGHAVFRVEDFQPDRMKLATTLNQPANAGWILPHEVQVKAHLETLFGFPAEGRRLTAKMELSPAEFAFESHPGYVFHNRLRKESQSVAGKKVELGESKSDAEGNGTFDLDLERFSDACFRMNLLVEAFEAEGGRSVRGGTSVLVSPYAYVVGYKGDGDLDYIGKDTVRNVKLVALNSALKSQDVDSLSQRIVQIKHVSVLTKGEDESYSYVSTRREQVVSEGPLSIAAAGTDVALPTTLPGEFRLELRDAENRVVCSCPFAVMGKGDSERSLERNAELELKLARDKWNSGENLELSLNAPYTGGGLITIEREGILGWKWFKSSTTSSVQNIVVPEGVEGTAYVNVSFVRALDSAEVFMSPLSYAVEPFTANPDKRRMEVTLDVPQIVKPGETLSIGYKTVEASRIVVYAVDEGIHQITRYTLPQPLTHFLRKRALEVGTEQLLDLIMPEYSLLARTSAFGGDEDEPPQLHLNPFKRRKEPPVVFWSEVLDAGPERKEVTYQVPDYFAGRLKVMAVAVSDEHMGQGETQCIVRGPFVLTPNVPTFAAPGDEFTVSLTVANNLEGAQASDSVNLTLTASEHVEVVEGAGSPLKVAPGKETTTRFRLRAKENLGGAEMTFRAEGGGVAMERRATMSVRPAAPYMTQVQSGYFRLPTQEVKVARQMHPEFARREATVSVLPLGLARGLEVYLREYPYGCSEQITSRAMARLVLADEADFGFTRAEAVEQLDHAFGLLTSRQAGNGGFGYWDAHGGGGLDFLSVYVTSFLTEAADAGFAVPESLLSGARSRMKEMARVKLDNLEQAWIQAAAIYQLTRGNEVTTPLLLNLRDTLESKYKDTWKQDVAAAYVAATYALLQKEDEGVKLMTAYQNAPKKNALSPGGWYYANPQVKNALAFALLCRHFPKLAGDTKYEDLAVITDPVQRGEFNTITSACTIMALKNYSGLAKRGGVKVSLSELLPAASDPRLLVPENDGLRTAEFAADASSLKFQLIRPGGAPDLGAFYQVMEAGFDTKLPTQAVRDGLEVVRELTGKDGKPLEQLRTGDSATVTLRVRNIGRHGLSDVALLDLMPGGFEVEPDNLKPGAGTMPGTQFVEVREDRNVFFMSLTSGESKTLTYRIKPVCAGTFQIPPAYVESMYDRAVNGRSMGGKLTVLPAE